MKLLLSRILLGIGAVSVTAALVALMAPRATHAFVAALVQITNTSANPVPVTDVGAVQPFQQSCTVSGTLCQITFPAGKRLVVQAVNIFAFTDVGIIDGTLEFYGQGNSFNNIPFELTFAGSSNGRNFFVRSQAITAYAYQGLAPNPSVNCSILLSSAASLSSPEMTCSITGYLVDQ